MKLITFKCTKTHKFKSCRTGKVYKVVARTKFLKAKDDEAAMKNFEKFIDKEYFNALRNNDLCKYFLKANKKDEYEGYEIEVEDC